MATQKLAPHVPQTSSDEGVMEAVQAALGGLVLDLKDHVGEITVTVQRDGVAEACRLLRDTPRLEYQQLMEIAGVDYPERPERFEVNYHLLSLTLNRRIRIKVATDEVTPVPTVTTLWPVAGWLEREVFDLYGVGFAGNPDLRRILTDYGFEGHPLRKDFPMTGHVEMRYSEAEKRVVYEPVQLAQDFRAFDFLTPWNGPEYRLPGDEKAEPQAPGAPSPAPASGQLPKVEAATPVEKRTSDKPYNTDNEDRKTAGAGQAHAEARKPNEAKEAQLGGVKTDQPEPQPGAHVTRDSGEAQ
jgi:NADH-quinone oxidoreductase subunit C